MIFSEDINEIAGALAKAQAKISNVCKDGNNPHFKSKYATLSAVLDEVRPILSENGISILQPASSDEHGNVVVETMLAHQSGQWMRSAIACRPVKADAQGMGSVITYLRRYSLAAMVGIAQADDDAEAGSGRGAPPADANPQMQPSRTVNATKGADKLEEAKRAQWAKWVDDFKAEFTAAESYLTARELWNAKKSDLDQMRKATPALFDELFAWVKDEGDKKPREAAE